MSGKGSGTSGQGSGGGKRVALGLAAIALFAAASVVLIRSIRSPNAPVVAKRTTAVEIAVQDAALAAAAEAKAVEKVEADRLATEKRARDEKTARERAAEVKQMSRVRAELQPGEETTVDLGGGANRPLLAPGGRDYLGSRRRGGGFRKLLFDDAAGLCNSCCTRGEWQ